MMVLILLQDTAYLLTWRAAKRTTLGSNARRFLHLIGINMSIYCITAISFIVLLITAILAAVASWGVGTNTSYPKTCEEWVTLKNSYVNWPLYRNAFVALAIALPFQFVRAIFDPLVHIIGSKVIRKSITFGIF